MPTASGTEPPYRIEPLGKQHDRSAFCCGSEMLDRYFKSQVTQDIRRRVAKCSVAVDRASGAVVGFYTLSATSLALLDLPDALATALPRYPAVPAVLMGRLAVATEAQGRQLGRALLAHAIAAIATGNIGAYALVVDAKDEAAVRFYAHYGFIPILGMARRLILPLATAERLLGMSKP
jgi:ribosomal protein S18 acetylase RimI-like enzyme